MNTGDTVNKNSLEIKKSGISELRMPLHPLEADVEIMNILTEYMKNNPDYGNT